MRKLSENFNYTYRLHLVLVIRIYFDKIWFIQKYKQQESWWNKKSFSYVVNYLNMFNTKHYIKYDNKYAISCYLLSFLHNLKLKSELIIVKKYCCRLSQTNLELCNYCTATKEFYHLIGWIFLSKTSLCLHNIWYTIFSLCPSRMFAFDDRNVHNILVLSFTIICIKSFICNNTIFSVSFLKMKYYLSTFF